MRLTDYLDKGASLGSTAPCLTMGERTLSYGEVQQFSRRFAASLAASGIAPGEKVAILSGNDPISFSCVFGISRAGGVWCPINPRNEAAENRDLLDLFDCRALFFQKSYAPLVDQIKDALPQLVTLVCIDGESESAQSLESWLGEEELDVAAPDDVTMLVGTGGTTGRPKGVMLTGHNIETMTAITLMSYPFEGRPVYLALAPLTHAAGVLCFPIMALGGEVVIMPKPDLGYFLANVQKHKVTHTFLPPTLIYMLLEHEALSATDLSSLQCFWYGAAPISPTRLAEAIDKIGPVMAQLFGQSEAPMMISTMSPKEHFGSDGTVATSRLSSAGRPSPLVTVGIMDDKGALLGHGERGEVVIRSSLVMAGYYKNPRRNRGSVSPRLASHRRYRVPGRRQFPVHRRPCEGHDHHRRFQRLFGRGGAGTHGVSGDSGLRSDRVAGRQVGRTRCGSGATAPRRRHRRRRGDGFREGSHRKCEDSEASHRLGRSTSLQGRQSSQERDQERADGLRSRLAHHVFGRQ